MITSLSKQNSKSTNVFNFFQNNPWFSSKKHKNWKPSSTRALHTLVLHHDTSLLWNLPISYFAPSVKACSTPVKFCLIISIIEAFYDQNGVIWGRELLKDSSSIFHGWLAKLPSSDCTKFASFLFNYWVIKLFIFFVLSFMRFDLFMIAKVPWSQEYKKKLMNAEIACSLDRNSLDLLGYFKTFQVEKN